MTVETKALTVASFTTSGCYSSQAVTSWRNLCPHSNIVGAQLTKWDKDTFVPRLRALQKCKLNIHTWETGFYVPRLRSSCHRYRWYLACSTAERSLDEVRSNGSRFNFYLLRSRRQGNAASGSDFIYSVIVVFESWQGSPQGTASDEQLYPKAMKAASASALVTSVLNERASLKYVEPRFSQWTCCVALAIVSARCRT